MSDPNDQIFYKLHTLDHAPKIAAALANVIIAWSHVEAVLLGLLQQLLQVEYPQAAVVFYSTPSFSGRVGLIKNLIETGKTIKGDPKPLSDALEAVRKLSKTRNSYVHNSWAATADGGKTVIFDYIEPEGTSGRRKPVTENDLKIHAGTVLKRTEALTDEILNVFPKAPIDRPVSIPIDGPQKGPLTASRLRALHQALVTWLPRRKGSK